MTMHDSFPGGILVGKVPQGMPLGPLIVSLLEYVNGLYRLCK